MDTHINILINECTTIDELIAIYNFICELYNVEKISANELLLQIIDGRKVDQELINILECFISRLEHVQEVNRYPR